VDQGVRIDPRRWNAIEVVPVSIYDDGALAATIGGLVNHHFRVDARGQVIRAIDWQVQQPAALSPNAIRIEVVQSGGETGMTRVQRLGLKTLLSQLNRIVRKGQGELPIRTGLPQTH
jgi:hypothetical protein